ncbi:hypothetical protein AC244_17575 [Ensifer adhaerens]|uniref:DUF4352 domain-containing protein n=1 Tax=Ensifer adhaerens TaxID=106592 RepID=A0A0L8BRK2_ENSAD|nr:hypothetical protein AC244_17575 [Ensifer adhaerens]
MPIARRSKLKRRLPAMLVTGIGGMVAAAVSFATAVYEAANPAPVELVKKDEPIDTGRWLVTINNASMAAVPPTGTKPVDAKRFLTVDLELDNRSAATSNAFMRLISIEMLPSIKLPEPVYYLARDKWIASAINPGMPEKVIAVWEWPEGSPSPKALRFSVAKQIYKPRDNLYGAPGWFEDGKAAIVEMAVSGQPDEAVQ